MAITSIDWSCKHDILLRNPDGSFSPMDEPWYEAEEIAPKTWRIVSAGDFSYLLAGEGMALLIDSGYGAGNIRAYAERLCGLPVPWIANTHDHFDHTANNAYFDLAYMTEKTRAAATLPFQSFEGIDFPRDYPVQVVKTGDVIPLPGRPVEVFEMPDHAAGSAAYLDRKSRILFTGDEIWENKPLNGDPGAFADHLAVVSAQRDAYDALWGGTGYHDPEVLEMLLRLCRRAAAGETGEPAVQPPNTGGHWSGTLPDGTLVYDRIRPHTGDGSRKGQTKRPDPSAMRQLTEGNVTIRFLPKEN